MNKIKLKYNLKSNVELASFLEIGPTTLSSWYSRNSIDYDKVIAKCVGVSLDWLLSDVEDDAEVKAVVKNTQKGTAELHATGIPLVNIQAFAGIGNVSFSIEEKNIQSRYIVPDFDNVDFMIRVKGNSMTPKYNSGDVVACRILNDYKFIQWNKTYILSTKDQGILIKRLKKSEDDKSVTAVSDNKDYDPFDIPWTEIDGIAIVVGVIRLE
ncbi:LexA family transcriptional regulator [Pedobacter sp. AW31-3R]|uniref:LexA family transcriptional regulator n=1 Tax=Pedobacter sp. AW31-3R TaxID=3445781 RepID=UPI003FA092EE